MLHVRKYSPFVALSFGVIVWMALIAWFPSHLIASTIMKILSDIASRRKRRHCHVRSLDLCSRAAITCF